MAIEIERRFLVRVSAALLAANLTARYTQAYLARGKVAVRVRQTPKGYFLTAKGKGTLSRTEVETVIDTASGEGFMAMSPWGPIVKDRTNVPSGGLVWEIDVFGGDLTGLLIAEVELPTEDTPTPPLPTGLTLIADITEEGAQYGNAALAALSPVDSAALVALVRARGVMIEPVEKTLQEPFSTQPKAFRR